MENKMVWHKGFPEELGEYFITLTSDYCNGKRFIGIAEFQGEEYDNPWVFDEYLRWDKTVRVIAWAELPDPYDGEEVAE